MSWIFWTVQDLKEATLKFNLWWKLYINNLYGWTSTNGCEFVLAASLQWRITFVPTMHQSYTCRYPTVVAVDESMAPRKSWVLETFDLHVILKSQNTLWSVKRSHFWTFFLYQNLALWSKGRVVLACSLPESWFLPFVTPLIGMLSRLWSRKNYEKPKVHNHEILSAQHWSL